MCVRLFRLFSKFESVSVVFRAFTSSDWQAFLRELSWCQYALARAQNIHHGLPNIVNFTLKASIRWRKKLEETLAGTYFCCGIWRFAGYHQCTQTLPTGTVFHHCTWKTGTILYICFCDCVCVCIYNFMCRQCLRICKHKNQITLSAEQIEWVNKWIIHWNILIRLWIPMEFSPTKFIRVHHPT